MTVGEEEQQVESPRREMGSVCPVSSDPETARDGLAETLRKKANGRIGVFHKICGSAGQVDEP